MKTLRLLLCLCLTVTFLLVPCRAFALEPLRDDAIAIAAPSAILMEKVTGQVLYEKNADERMLPASVTKIMTLLLIVEDIEAGKLSLEDTVTASARAASFGGSCVYLEEGEQMSVHEMLKCIAVASANDCAVAMAEQLAGTEALFVERMNARAQELGLENTHFTNCTGLFEDAEHYSSARDIAVMSRALISHDLIKDYSTIWMDSIRDGSFGLTNTNKLVYWYEGCTGLKTGFTSGAMYCLSATAERDGMELIAVVLKAPSSEQRFADARALLDYGFANYALVTVTPEQPLAPVAVHLGESAAVQPVLTEDNTLLLEKAAVAGMTQTVTLAEGVDAPVAQGDRLGELTVADGEGNTLAVLPILAGQDVPRLTWWQMAKRVLRCGFCAA